MKPALPTVVENVWVSDSFQKVITQKDDSTKKGGIDWQIFNYKTSSLCTKEFYPNAKIVKSYLCDKEKVNFTHEVLDTTIDFKGWPAKVMIVHKEGKKVAELYYTDEYKTSPAFYACSSGSILNYLYKVIKGGSFCSR